VIACEPLANVANALEATIAENGFTGRTTVHRIALDARSGTVLLRHAPVTINQGGSYLAPAAALPPGHVDVSVPARTLDEIVGDGPCAFIKLDAEGAEPRIIAGGSRTFARCRPVMLAELNRQLLEHVGNTTPDDVIARMAAHGYVARRLRGPAPGEIVERYDEAATLNVVFSPLG
jgi:FkbM family methyltransferase